MSSTFISGRAVIRLTQGANPFVALFEETAESNLYPQIPSWSCWFIGRLSEGLEKIIRGSYYFDGGCKKGARGRAMKPESDLKAWKQALICPFKACSTTAKLTISRPYRSCSPVALCDRAQAIKDVCDSIGSKAGLTLHSYFSESYFQFDLTSEADLEAISLLVNRRIADATTFQEANNTLVSSWELMGGFFNGFGSPAEPIELLPLQPTSEKNFSILSIVTVPFATSPDYIVEKQCVVINGQVVSENALQWICNGSRWHLGASDEIAGAIRAIGDLKKIIQKKETLSPDEACLFAEPMDVTDLSTYQSGLYSKLIIGSFPKKLSAETISISLGLIEKGLVVRVGNNANWKTGSVMPATTEVQEALCF